MAENEITVGDTFEVMELRGSEAESGIKVGDRFKVSRIGSLGMPIALVNGSEESFFEDSIKLVRSGKRAATETPKFILQYELDRDPFELIYNEKELRKRIAELAAKPDLKRDSIKVYDIKRVRNVELGVKITIK